MATLEDAIAEAGDSDFLVIHDPCRSTVAADVFTRMTQTLRAGEGAAVVAAVPVTDTLKEVDAERRIVGTVDRGATWEVRTPHGYRLDALAGALARARAEGITDAMVHADPSLLPGLVEGPVRVVPLSRDSLHDDALAGHDGSSIMASTRRRSAG